ncbi:MAG: FtsX-like permease family protein [Acidimicrobiales bacterium]
MTASRALIALAAARLRQDWPLVTVTVIVVYAALIQLASAPMYAESVAVGALRWKVTDISAASTIARVDLSANPDVVDAAGRRVTSVFADARSLDGAEVSERLVSPSFELPDQPDSAKTEVTVFASVEQLPEHSVLTDGTWPNNSPGEGSRLAAAIEQEIARRLELTVGSSLDVVRRRDGMPVTVEIVGVYEITDRFERYWAGAPLLATGLLDGRSFRTIGPLVVDRAPLLAGRVGRLDASWVVLPSVSELTLAQADQLRSDVEQLPVLIENELMLLTSDEREAIGGLAVESDLPEVLRETTESISVSRAGVTSIAVQLGILGALALGITAAILMNARRDQLVLLVTRGMSRAHLIGLAALEAALVLVPAAAVAPFLAVLTVRVAARTGPIESLGFDLDPTPSISAYLVVVPAALFMFVLLVLPMARATSRRSLRSLERGSREATPQRIGLDLALLVVVLGAFWQLGRLGAASDSVLRDRFSIDPLLVITPPLALVSGAVVTLRIIPLLARVGDRIANRRRTVIGALVSWQLARRPAELARSVFLLALAVAILVFASTYAASWDKSQGDQAAQQVGSDVRVHPDRRTGQALDDLNLIATHQAIEGVDDALAISRIPGPFPSTQRGAEFVAIDAGRAHVVQPAVGSPEELAAGLAALAERRPDLPGLPLPAGATSLEISVVVEEEQTPHPEAESLILPPALQGRFDALLVDEAGLLHRVELGALVGTEEGTGAPLDVSVDLVGEGRGTDGRLRLVGFEMQIVAPTPPARNVTITVGALEAVVDGDTETISLADAAWLVDSGATGRQFEPTAGFVTTDPATGRQVFQITTGSAAGSVVGLLEFRVGPTSLPAALPVLVSESWLATTGTEIGDSFAARVNPTATGLVEVVGSVEAFPTVSPDLEAFVIADLATVQAMAYRPDRRIDAIDEVWLTLDPAADRDTVAGALAGEPLTSVTAVGREELTAELRADPTALSAIGAFSVGAAAAVVFAVLVFVTVAATAVHGRRGEFLLLRSLGLAPRELRRWMAAEHAVLLFLALGLGTGIGAALAYTVLPEITLDQTGATVYPPARVVVDGIRIVTLQVLIAAVIGAIVIGLTRYVARRSMAEELLQGVST